MADPRGGRHRSVEAERGFGHHPLLAFLDATGEALAGILRPGNAGSNTTANHVELLAMALAQLPADPAAVEIIARADSAALTHGFIDPGARLAHNLMVRMQLVANRRRPRARRAEATPLLLEFRTSSGFSWADPVIHSRLDGGQDALPVGANSAKAAKPPSCVLALEVKLHND